MVGRYRWCIAGLIGAASVLGFLDRGALAILAPMIASELQLGPAQVGVAFGAFFGGFALFCFAGSWAADRFGPKRSLAVSVALWSVFAGLTGAAWGFGALIAIRAAFGMAEAPLAAVANKMVRNWFPRTEAARVIALAVAGSAAGIILSGPIIGTVARTWGWRSACVVIGLAGLAWLLPWLALATDHPAPK